MRNDYCGQMVSSELALLKVLNERAVITRLGGPAVVSEEFSGQLQLYCEPGPISFVKISPDGEIGRRRL